MAVDREPLGYDVIIALRDRLLMQCGCEGLKIRYGERDVNMPRMEDMCVYRGETHDHGGIRSGVYRAEDVVGQCVSKAKMNEFIGMLKDIPIIRDELSPIMPVKAIAQHYGLHTDCVDFSGSFAVALFFATCKSDRKTGRYRPLNHREIRDNPIGMIYVTMPMAYINDLDFFMPIGYSVLKRPSLQHGYLMVDHGNLSQKDFGVIQIE